MAPVSTPPAPKVNPLLVPVEEPSKAERIYCEKCGAEAKPFSRYCEGCGTDVWERSSGRLSLPDKDSYKTLVESAEVTPESVATVLDSTEYLGEEAEPAAGPATNISPDVQRQRSNRAALGMLVMIAAALLVLGSLGVWMVSRSGWGGKGEKTAAVEPARPVEPGPNSISQEEAARPEPVPPEGMVYVPGGTFMMGRNDGDAYEAPAHEVKVGPFFIDVTEVTNEEYQRFVSATGRAAPSSWTEGRYPDGHGRYPVVSVKWSDAAAYAGWLGKRLPTEEEWEFAARGTDGRLYPWGSSWNGDLTNADRAAKGSPMEAGSFAGGASPFRALDMSGNVWEWTSSDLTSYADGKGKPEAGKVIRGGAFDVPPERATATYRGFVPPEKAYDKTGFRCVRDIAK